MKTSVAFALAAAKLIAGHATFQQIIVDGKAQEAHYGVQDTSNANNPIYDVTSSSMVCNGGTVKTGEFVEVAAGSTVGLQWHHNDGPPSGADSDEPIAPSHKGPVMVYIAKAEGNGEGAVWTKIYEDGLSGGKWGVDNFIAAKGIIDVTLPDLEDGEYLIRPEVIGLHEAQTEAKAQFYNGCGQLKITGGSVALPASGTDMTKAYSPTDPGVKVDIYNGISDYTIPGPKVWDGASSGGTPTTPTTPSKPSETPSATPSAEPSQPAEPSNPEPSQPAEPSNPPTYETPSTLPESFSVDELIAWIQETVEAEGRPKRHSRFISWLKENTSGSSTKMARRHAREFKA